MLRFRHALLLLIIVLPLLFGMPDTARSIDEISAHDVDYKFTVNPRFGAIESYYRPRDAAMAGVGWDRIIFEWRYLQPESSKDWTPAAWEHWLRDAKSGNRQIVGLVKNAPYWATGTKNLGEVPVNLDLPIDDPKNYWAVFIRKLVTYYKDRGIHNWIIYNEPDIRPGDTENGFYEFAGEVEDYYKMVKVAYKVAHEVDPEAVIHLAGMNYWFDVVRRRPLYLRRFLQLATADKEGKANNYFFDVMTVHIHDRTDWVWEVTRNMKRQLEAFGIKKPVWINELNARVTTDGNLLIRGIIFRGDPEITVDDQASFVLQSISLAMAQGVERVGIYKLNDNHYSVQYGAEYNAWGLIRGDGTRRPGFYALRTVNQYFVDIMGAERFTNVGVTAVALRQPGQTTYVFWNDSGEAASVWVKVDEAGTAEVISAVGSTQEITTEEVKGRGHIYKIDLPPCNKFCVVKGEPRMIILKGEKLHTTWAVKGRQFGSLITAK